MPLKRRQIKKSRYKIILKMFLVHTLNKSCMFPNNLQKYTQNFSNKFSNSQNCVNYIIKCSSIYLEIFIINEKKHGDLIAVNSLVIKGI